MIICTQKLFARNSPWAPFTSITIISLFGNSMLGQFSEREASWWIQYALLHGGCLIIVIICKLLVHLVQNEYRCITIVHKNIKSEISHWRLIAKVKVCLTSWTLLGLPQNANLLSACSVLRDGNMQMHVTKLCVLPSQCSVSSVELRPKHWKKLNNDVSEDDKNSKKYTVMPINCGMCRNSIVINAWESGYTKIVFKIISCIYTAFASYNTSVVNKTINEVKHMKSEV